ncbi:MAG TPA: hypothetical protein VJP78_08675, partial [Thermoleophilia bacterium]|nr:hypothetical protein [Thermoleophilia bacterium]
DLGCSVREPGEPISPSELEAVSPGLGRRNARGEERSKKPDKRAKCNTDEGGCRRVALQELHYQSPMWQAEGVLSFAASAVAL